jgi:hypothetical protein
LAKIFKRDTFQGSIPAFKAEEICFFKMQRVEGRGSGFVFALFAATYQQLCEMQLRNYSLKKELS